jgi:hypothetical protein
MNALLRRFLMHYGIYRRYPLGRLPALLHSGSVKSLHRGHRRGECNSLTFEGAVKCRRLGTGLLEPKGAKAFLVDPHRERGGIGIGNMPSPSQFELSRSVGRRDRNYSGRIRTGRCGNATRSLDGFRSGFGWRFEPVSAETQPVSGRSRSKFRILKNHRAETGAKNSRRSARDVRHSSPETGLPAASLRKCRHFVSTRNPQRETELAGWAERIRTAMCSGECYVTAPRFSPAPCGKGIASVPRDSYGPRWPVTKQPKDPDCLFVH